MKRVKVVREKFRDIILNEYVTNYSVSNFGRIKNNLTGKILKQETSRNGYRRVSLCVNKKSTHQLVHRLVAIAFIECPGKFKDYQVNHKDGDKTNNFVCNLEWCTASENIKHALANNLKSVKHLQGVNNFNNKYNEDLIIDICKLIEKRYSANQIIKTLHLKNNRKSLGLINEILHRQRWKHISKDYNFPKKIKRIYTEELVRDVCKLLEKKYRPRDIIKELKLENSVAIRLFISHIKHRDSWNDISKDYRF